MSVDPLQEIITELQMLWESVLTFTPRLVIGLIIGLLVVLIATLTRRWGKRLSERINAPRAVETLIINLVYVLALTVGTIITLSVLGVNVAGLVAGLGVGGLVVGFALQDIIRNLISGSLLLIERPFNLGDVIKINGQTGTVTNVQLRHTTLLTFDRTEVLIPNSLVYTSILENITRNPVRRRALTLRFDHDTNLGQAMELVLKTVNSVDGIASYPVPTFGINDFGDTTIDGTLYYYFNTVEHDWFGMQNQVTEAVRQATQAEGISLLRLSHMNLVNDEVTVKSREQQS
ncbi:MAG: mechanosensitive ion channel [Chloroflexi bacterium]|nr:mechanosensitive ion channel [Chloroflexota bacterium]